MRSKRFGRAGNHDRGTDNRRADAAEYNSGSDARARAGRKRERRFPERRCSEIFEGIRRQGAHAHLPRSIQCQQSIQRQRRP